MVPVYDDHRGSENARLYDPSRELSALRSRLHGRFGRRADALFELRGALLTAGSVPSPVHPSLAPVHRRGWGSFYAALEKGRIDEDALKELLASHDPGAEGTTPVYAVDVSPGPRCDAECSPGRGYLYHLSHRSAHRCGLGAVRLGGEGPQALPREPETEATVLKVKGLEHEETSN